MPPTSRPFELQPGDWPQPGRDPAHTSDNGAETALSPTTVAGLRVAWTATVGNVPVRDAVVADGAVYVTTGERLYAFPVGCGTGEATCAPLWSAGDNLSSAPAVADGVVYVRSDGELYAYPVDCAGGAVCAPLWTAAIGGYGMSAPLVADGHVFVTSGYSGMPHDSGRVFAFAAGCATGGGTCLPAWTASTEYAISWRADSSLAVDDGVVYVGTEDGTLYAFAVDCGISAATCSPLWTAATHDTIGASPAVAGGVVYATGSDEGRLYAFAVDCATGGATCSPLWTGTTTVGNLLSSPAIADGVVYVSQMRTGWLYAFPAHCARISGANCSPLWRANTGSGSSAPSVAGGLVYVASVVRSELQAFAVGCADDGTKCSPIWTTPIESAQQPAIADGVVYIGSDAGELNAFAVVSP